MHKSAFFAIALSMVIVSPVFGVAFADNVVGVTKGDWIRYQVTETGNPAPQYDITWARMDIISVQGEVITVNVLTAFRNGTLFPENGINFNLATGAIGDGFFVPTNLNPGDHYSTEYEGIINITGVGLIEAGGANRAVLIGVTNESTYNWDRQTGIMVAATSKLPGCIMYTKTSATDMWAPQILGLNQTVFYALIVAVGAILAVSVAVVMIYLWRRKKPRAFPTSGLSFSPSLAASVAVAASSKSGNAIVSRSILLKVTHAKAYR
jgi:hypothetical protein